MTTKPIIDTARTSSPVVLGGTAAFSEPIYITRPLIPDEQAFHARLKPVFESRWLTNNGPLVRELEAGLAATLNLAHCKVFCNGTVALQAALRALDLTGEVITTPFTFPATVHAIEWNGLQPVFCDIDPRTYNLDVEHAASLVGAATSALVPVHVFGNPCDAPAIGTLAQHHGLKVIYDAAHAFAVEHAGTPVCSWGDLSILSFHATKLFNTCEGGAVVARDAAVSEKIALLRNFGIVSQSEVRGVGLNGKLSELHAAVGLCVLDAVKCEIEARAVLARRYRDRLREMPGITMQQWSVNTTQNHAYFAIEIDEEEFGLSRDVLHDALRAENIIVRRYFYPLCSENESYRHLESAHPENLPNAHRLSRRVLCLPLYGELRLDDVDLIVDRLALMRSRSSEIRAAMPLSRGE